MIVKVNEKTHKIIISFSSFKTNNKDFGEFIRGISTGSNLISGKTCSDNMGGEHLNQIEDELKKIKSVKKF